MKLTTSVFFSLLFAELISANPPLKLVESITFQDDRQTRQSSSHKRGCVARSHPIEDDCAQHQLRSGFNWLRNIAPIAARVGPFKRGCLLYYTFDGDDPRKAADNSGKNNHGKLRGTGWTPQRIVFLSADGRSRGGKA